MSPEELFEQNIHIAEVTINRMYNNPIGICRKHRIEYEDLLQYARTGLWKGCLSYQDGKGTKFITHAINNIKWHVTERLNRETSMIRYSCNRDYDKSDIYGIVSMDAEINDSDNSKLTYHDVCANSTEIESDVISEITSNNIWDKLNEQQKEIIELLSKGKSFNQIGTMWNMTGENVKFKIKKARRSLENLGLHKPNKSEKVINRSLGRKVSIEGKIYSRIKDASAEMNIRANTICDRLKSNSDKYREWYYVN